MLAAISSAVLPGTGQMLLGCTPAGMLFLSLFVILAAMYWPLRLPASYIGLMMLVLFTVGLNTAAALHVLTTRTESGLRSLRGWTLVALSIASSLSIVHITFLCLAAGIHLYGVPSASMEPAIWRGDHIVVDVRAYRNARPHSPDIIIFRKFGLLHVKRVVGTGGETIEGKDGVVTVNRRRIEEPYVRHIRNALRLDDVGPMGIPPGKLFVMGDNRDASMDSRTPQFGLVDEQDVLGKALYILNSKSHTRIGLSLLNK